jgi:hypothetical protein
MYKQILAWAKHRAALGIVLAIAGLISTSSWAVTMESIEFSSLPGDRTEIHM